MARRKDDKEPPRLVWRITADAPLGEYVDPKIAARPKRPKTEGEEVRERSWLGSSLELLGGVRVSETPMETLPGELIDEFFKTDKKDEPKKG
ncbi:hypothetical protein [Piscinibacter defluvii]|uniref:hypothetical protein n=1 Tax=Piscinibacter defluvii TaxID=1796922 RepID=UPI000FDEE5A8|nr:hypothetical protein [Piscinibacter defluvii]